ncbi:MAG: hypothetical protein J4F35_09540 [Candidatus Latescibacteria bacterium]|nr:hypothetical protein [Candidatus Latescibacterota bacterium]
MQKRIPTHYLAHLSDRYLVELPGSGLSWRSMLLGLGLVVAISIGSPYSIWMVGSSEMTWSYFPIAVGAPLFILVLVNALLKRALSATELITIIIMGLVASGMPIFMVGLILSIISKPYYGALPTNQWAEYGHPRSSARRHALFLRGLAEQRLGHSVGSVGRAAAVVVAVGAGHILRRLVLGGGAAPALDGARAADLPLD